MVSAGRREFSDAPIVGSAVLVATTARGHGVACFAGAAATSGGDGSTEVSVTSVSSEQANKTAKNGASKKNLWSFVIAKTPIYYGSVASIVIKSAPCHLC